MNKTETMYVDVGGRLFPLLVKTVFNFEVLSHLDLGLGYYTMSFLLESDSSSRQYFTL